MKLNSKQKKIFFILFSDDEFGEKTVSILLDGEESEMIFIDHPSHEMSVSTMAHLNSVYLSHLNPYIIEDTTKFHVI